MVTASRPRVICVDDEPHVVGGLALHLRRRYDVELATSAQAGLELLDRGPPAAVMISDMRMPGMNGAEFLARASATHPETTRVLLTGYAELEAATRAINEGRVFKFLIKPCPPPELLRTVEAAVELHRALVTEKALLENALSGSIQMLADVMAVINPAAFGRAHRIKQLVSALSVKLGEPPSWQLEVAALLSQLGSIALPHETVDKLHSGAALTSSERSQMERAPEVIQHLLGHIPRLETVRRMLAVQHATADVHRPPGAEMEPEERMVRRGAQLLKGALELDVLDAQGMSGTGISAAFKAHAQDYDAKLLEALLQVCAERPRPDAFRELPLSELCPGMVLAADVKTLSGTLFAARGCEVTPALLERAATFRPGALKEPLKVFEP